MQKPGELSRVGFPRSLRPLASPASPLAVMVWQRSWFYWARSKHLPSLVAGLPGFLAASPARSVGTPRARGGGEQEGISLPEMQALQTPASQKGDPAVKPPCSHQPRCSGERSLQDLPNPRLSGPRVAPWPPREPSTFWGEAIPLGLAVGAQRALASCKPSFLCFVNFISRTIYSPLQETPSCKG